MSFDNSSQTTLSFAILPIVIPLNPINGTIIKVKKKKEGEETLNAEENQDNNFDKLIDPTGIHKVTEDLDIRVIEINNKGIINNSGYHLFLNLPESLGHTIRLKSNMYLDLENYIDSKEFDSDRRQTSTELTEGAVNKNQSPDRTIIVYPVKKQLLSTVIAPTPFIKGIVIYPSKTTILKVILTKIQMIDFPTLLHEKPIVNANIFLKRRHEDITKENSDKFKISATTSFSNTYEFSKLDSIRKIGVIEGSYDELDYSPLRGKDYLNFEDQNKGKFWLVVKEGNSSNIEMRVEIKIEKRMTTLLNVLIIE